jgi:hypothetical protein
MMNVQMQLSFLEEEIEGDPVPLWSTLDNEQRAETIETLARVIAKQAVTSRTAEARENDNE